MLKANHSNFVIVMCAALFALFASLAWAGDVTEEPVAQPEPEIKATPADSTATGLDDKVIAYYFHGDRRCATCIKLENYSQGAVETGFVEELEQGTLEWQVVNYDRDENAHFLEDYELYTKAVILSRLVEGEETEWVNLDRIWELVGDQDEFTTYVQTEIKAFLTKAAE